MTLRQTTLLLRLVCWLLLVALAGCDWSAELGLDGDNGTNDDSTPPAAETDIAGLDLAIADVDVDSTYDQLLSDISARTGYVVRVDHQANARSVNRTLRPTRVILFDEPNRSAPLIAADPRAGLDLPAKLLVYRDADGDVAVAYNDPGYLAARYNLEDAQNGALDGLGEDLRTLAQEAAGNGISREGSNAGISEGEGVVERDSDNDFATTRAALRRAIAARDNLTLIAEIDQQADAASRNIAIRPSVLFVFGNPDVGTSLMRSSQTAGIDLPQKMLVSAEPEGSDVRIYYNDPQFIAARHDIGDRDDEVNSIAGLLSALADSATRVPP